MGERLEPQLAVGERLEEVEEEEDEGVGTRASLSFFFVFFKKTLFFLRFYF
jgi:hypothetical protein